MKKSIIVSLLFLIEAIMCGVLVKVIDIGNNNVDSMMAYPFEALAEKLYKLSTGGNDFLAWLIMIEIVLVPIVILAVSVLLRKFRIIDIMLPIMSGYLAGMIYIFINPSIMIKLFGREGYYSITDIENIICSIFYILVISYVILVIIDTFKDANEKKIISFIEVIVVVIGFVLIGKTFFDNYIECIKNYYDVHKEFSSFGVDLVYTKRFLAMKSLIEVLSNAMYLIMAVLGIDILDSMKKDRFSEKVLKQTKFLGRLGMISIVLMVMLNLLYNIIALPYISKLYGDFRCFVFPVYFIVFTLCILLFSKYMEDTKKIKDDNDLFV